MNKIEMQKYLNERIHNKMYAKTHHCEYEVNYYFKNRHTGLANIDSEQAVALVYGAIREEELFTITKGLIIFLDLKGFNTNVAVVDETIDEDKAVAWNTFQGTSVSFVFAGDMLDAEETIKEVVLDGLKYLRYKNDYLGFYRSDSHV